MTRKIDVFDFDLKVIDYLSFKQKLPKTMF